MRHRRPAFREGRLLRSAAFPSVKKNLKTVAHFLEEKYLLQMAGRSPERATSSRGCPQGRGAVGTRYQPRASKRALAQKRALLEKLMRQARETYSKIELPD